MNSREGKVARNKWGENPGYDLRLDAYFRRVTVSLGGEVIADSRNVTIVREQGHGPVYYFPREDLRMNLLRRTDHRSHCPYKGQCSYFSIVVGGEIAENAVWSYEDPYPEMAGLMGLAAFYPNRVDAIVAE